MIHLANPSDVFEVFSSRRSVGDSWLFRLTVREAIHQRPAVAPVEDMTRRLGK
jgi:hypothetical protein